MSDEFRKLRELVESLRAELVGKRVRLVHCNDPWSPPPAGTLGTVSSVDDVATVHINWDNGSTLGLIPGHDHWVVVEGE